uniref:Regulatory protein E2 n=1 Tax=Human papillomavirus TaxID=10566 RepID=A0A385PIB0_9PAPI|nr:MAG: E2 protein [Human papillomavirus]
MNQADLTRRSDALQEKLMNLYEEGAKNIDAQIEHWNIIKQQYILYYYARKEGFKNLGLQILPTYAVSEYKAKEAIQQILLLQSLKQSEFGNEEWTLSNTSAELTLTSPRYTFKKEPYIVDVWFDNNPENSFPYTNWNKIYFQDEQEHWHRAEGQVDINGLYFVDLYGDKNYFVLFAPDVEKYSTTGQWTVNFKNQTISSVDSSQTRVSDISPQGSVSSSRDTVLRSATTTWRRFEGEERSPSSTTPSSPDLRSGKRRRRYQQREPSPRGRSKRRREEETTGPVSPGEVGRGSHTVPRRGLGRIERLTEEARDPPIIIVKGGANNLKCWRNRCQKTNNLYTVMSTVFRYPGTELGHRMLIGFRDFEQRTLFLKTTTFPRGCTFSLGSVDSL